MRNSVLPYFMILFLLVSLSGISQSADMGTGNSREVILNSPREKEAFESKSITQIEDFYNYLNLVSDPEIDLTLREHALKMALKTSVVDASMVNLVSDDHEPMRLTDFLILLINENRKITFSFNQIENFGALENLVFTYQLNINRGADTKQLALKHTFKVFLQEKAFGSKLLQVSDLKATGISLD